MSPIVLTRGHAFDMGTFGRLAMPDGFSCVVCERPWQGNKRRLSCIPPGTYELAMRRSEVVRATTGGKFSKGWEVTGVPERDHIMLHPGNTIDDTEGCLLPGESFGGWTVEDEYRWAVTHSQRAFERLMSVLGGADSWTLEIRYAFPEYP